jgi:mannose-1-phosphate guanylyltransferase/mannose-6-phosphate isomerase
MHDAMSGSELTRIVLKRGASLLLSTPRRVERWLVVSGTAKVTQGTDERFYYRSESLYLPSGTAHRLVNAGTVDLVMVEDAFFGRRPAHFFGNLLPVMFRA